MRSVKLVQQDRRRNQDAYYLYRIQFTRVRSKEEISYICIYLIYRPDPGMCKLCAFSPDLKTQGSVVFPPRATRGAPAGRPRMARG